MISHLWCALQAVSIVFFTETWRPDSFYDRIAANRRAGLHTLCLLDIKVKEPSLEALARGKTVYEPARSALPSRLRAYKQTRRPACSCLQGSRAQRLCDRAWLACCISSS